MSSRLMETLWSLISEYLIIMITFYKQELALFMGWEMLLSCALLRAKDPSHPIVADTFFTSWQGHMDRREVIPKIILNRLPL